MKKSKLGIFAFVLIASLCLYSCNSDSDDDVTSLSDNCAITNMTLGNLLRRVTIRRSTDGRDTTYTTTFYGGHYAMLVDQLNHVIYNPDSLPLGTKIEKILFSQIAADGIVAYRTEWGTDTIYSGGDSLNFSHPRTFTCYSKSGKAKQSYEVRVNVHQVNSEQFAWAEMPAADALREASAQKLLVKNGKLYDFAVVGERAYLFTSSTSDASTWTKHELSGFTSLNPHSVQLFKNQFFAVAAAGLVSSEDGVAWTSVGSSFHPDQLIASGSSSIYALKDGSVYGSTDGVTWTKDEVDDLQSAFPAENFSSAWSELNFNNNFEYILWGGTDKNGECALWKKTVDNTGVNNDVWSCYSGSEEVSHPFPALKSTVLLNYDKKMVALGCLNDTVSLMYVSEDAGRSWESKNAYVHPFELRATNIGCAVDADNYIWIVCAGSGLVVRGRLNRLGFANEQTAFK